jgi:hypothetical protein
MFGKQIYDKTGMPTIHPASLLFSIVCLIGCLGDKSDKNFPIKEDIFKRDSVYVNCVEYQTGNIPLILCAPHDGQQSVGPNGKIFTERTRENCNNPPSFEKGADGQTKKLIIALDKAIFKYTGQYPHLVICDLKRSYVEPNIKLLHAVPHDENGKPHPNNEAVYNTYHGYLDDLKNEIIKIYGAGLLLDIHGHGHAVQEIEVGYSLALEALKASDEELNAEYAPRSTNYYLSQVNKANATMTQLVRGDSSLGQLLIKYGLPAMPSKDKAYPDSGDDYYNTGYTSRKYGSSTEHEESTGGKLDAIQLEFNRNARQEATIPATADAAAKAIRDYLNLYYRLNPLNEIEE